MKIYNDVKVTKFQIIFFLVNSQIRSTLTQLVAGKFTKCTILLSNIVIITLKGFLY